MEVYVLTGEWICSILKKIDEATDGTNFFLPSEMHLHAFYLALESLATNKKINVYVKTLPEFHEQPTALQS